MLSLYVRYVGLKGRVAKAYNDFKSTESGATAIEYGLIAALISVVIIGAVTAIGTNLSAKFNSVSSNLH